MTERPRFELDDTDLPSTGTPTASRNGNHPEPASSPKPNASGMRLERGAWRLPDEPGPDPAVRDTLRASARALMWTRETHELRVLDPNGGRAFCLRWFNSSDALADAVAGMWDGRGNVYVTLNPTDPKLLERRGASDGTKDRQITRRIWFPVDVDAQRAPSAPKPSMSTDAELATALVERNAVVEYLRGRGFPAPLLAMSGNGGHALFACELPNDAATTALVQRALLALKEKFSSVDASVYNPARIWKLYGSLAMKGTATAERPHRRATITQDAESDELADGLLCLTLDALTKLAEEAPKEGKKRKTKAAPTAEPEPAGAAAPNPWPAGSLRDLLAEFTALGTYLRDEGDGVRHSILCPWYEEHSGETVASAAVLFDHRSEGQPWGFKCLHEHCGARDIRDVLAWLDGLEPEPAVEPPPITEPPEMDAEPAPSATAPEPPEPEAAQAPPSSGAPSSGLALRARKLSDVKAKAIEWVWRERYARGYLTGIFGDGGTCKSTFELTVTARLTTGRPMPLDSATRPPGTCVMLSLEDDAERTIKPRLIAAGGDPSRLVIIESVIDRRSGKRVRQVDLEKDLELLRAALLAHQAVHFTVSPVSAYLGSTRDSWKDSDVRNIIDPLHAMAAELGISGALIAHPNKSTKQRAAYRMSGSQAFRNACRLVLVTAVDPEDASQERLVIVGEKANVSKLAPPLAFRKRVQTYQIDGEEVEAISLDFEPEALDRLKYTADFLLGEHKAEEASALEEAKRYLARRLPPDGSKVPSDDVEEEAEARGIRPRTLDRARAALNVQVDKEPGRADGRWRMWIPVKDHPANRARRSAE